MSSATPHPPEAIMLRSLEFATVALFLLLSVALLALWSWVIPDLWAAIDMRTVVGTIALTSLGLGWVLARIHDPADPEPA